LAHSSATGGQLALADRRRGLDIDDHRMIQVDQVVGAVGEAGRPGLGGGPARGRIRQRDVFGRDRRGRAEGRVVQDRQILLDSPPGGLGRQACGAVDSGPVPAGVGADVAGVDGEALAADQALGHAAAHHALEQLSQQIAVAKAAVAVLGEGGVIRYVAVQAQAAEPAVGEVEVNLLAQPTLGAYAHAVAGQRHPGHQFRIDRRPVDRAVERRQMGSHATQIHEPIDGAQQVILGHVPIKRELVEQGRLLGPKLARHGCNLLLQQE
jgi:hypothetical protein